LLKVLEAASIVLLVSVAEALFFVASDVLSTLPSPTSAFTRPDGLVIVGLVSVLLVNVLVDVVVGTSASEDPLLYFSLLLSDESTRKSPAPAETEALDVGSIFSDFFTLNESEAMDHSPH
jgi:hypothetical protein